MLVQKGDRRIRSVTANSAKKKNGRTLPAIATLQAVLSAALIPEGGDKSLCKRQVF